MPRESSAKGHSTNGVANRGKVVALTGSLDALRSCMLLTLQAQNAVLNIYWLNKDNSSARRSR
jgi:hypothetical protein